MAFLQTILTLIYVVGTYRFLHRAAHKFGDADLSLFVYNMSLILSILVGLLAHEAGHWVAGNAVGWRCLGFRIGPVECTSSAGGWKARRRKWMWGAGVVFAPVVPGGSRRDNAILVAGGPLGSVVFALVCAAIASQAHTATFLWFFGTMAQYSLLVGAIQLLPTGDGLGVNDGHWLWALLRGGERAEQRKRYMLENTSSGTPFRARDWPCELIGPVLESGASCTDRHYCFLAYKHLMDSGRPDEALPWLVGFLAKPAKSDPPEYALEAAFYLGVHRRDPALAAKWLAFAGTDEEIWIRRRAQAAVAWVGGRTEDARRLALEALAQLDTARPCGETGYQRDRLDDLLRQVAESAVPAAAVTGPFAFPLKAL